MKIKANTLWETRANEIADQIKYLELWDRKIYFKKVTPNKVVYAPHFSPIDYKGSGLEATTESRHIEVITFLYSEDRTIKHLLETGALIQDKTKEYGIINNANSLVRPPMNTIPAMYSSFADKQVLDKLEFESDPVNSESHLGGNNYEQADSALELILEDTTLLLSMSGKFYPIGRMRYGSENYYVFSHLLDNPNKEISATEIKDKFGLKVMKPFSKTLDNVHIVGALRDAFFISANSKIRINNPIKLSKLKKLGISPEELIPQR